MRIVTVSALAGACLLQVVSASAADLDYGMLRGSDYEPAPAPVVDWSGFYLGGHGGWSSTAYGFSSALQPLAAEMLYRTTIESEVGASGLLRPTSRRTTGGTFGVFGGYNFVADDFVFGLEGDYTYLDKAATSSDSISRSITTSDGYTNYISQYGTASMKLQEYGTIRGRVGYALGSVLPFVTAGVAFGRAQVTDTVGIQSAGYDAAAANKLLTGTATIVGNYGYTTFDVNALTTGFSPYNVQRRSAQKYAAGFAAGFGLDVALTSNIFLRGEYQYILFDDFGGHKANVNTVRAAAAVKF